MTDDVVRAAVLEWLAGDLDLDQLDDLEELAFDRMIPGATGVADAVAHVLSAREQFTPEELHLQLLDIASTVVVDFVLEPDPTSTKASTASSASVVDMRPRLERRRRRASFTATADRQLDTALG